MKRLSLLLIAALPRRCSSATVAQDFPTRQMTIIVPFAPGGSADIVARIYAQKLTERLGKPVVVENRAGAGTVIGALAAARAAPDGYTLFMGGSSALAYNPTLHKQLPYDPAKDFVPLAHVASLPVRAGGAALAAGAFGGGPDQARQGQAGPSRLRDRGRGLARASLRRILQRRHRHRHHLHSLQGHAPAVTDFLAGHVPTMFVDVPPVLPLIRDGKMRALGVSSIKPVPAAPELTPLAQAGVPGYDAGGWLMFAAPSATPKEIVAKLHAELKAITATPDIQQRFTGMGLVPIDSPPVENLQRYVVSEIERWGKVIRAAGIEASQ